MYRPPLLEPASHRCSPAGAGKVRVVHLNELVRLAAPQELVIAHSLDLTLDVVEGAAGSKHLLRQGSTKPGALCKTSGAARDAEIHLALHDAVACRARVVDVGGRRPGLPWVGPDEGEE
jgi:hypothetical protein